MTPKRFIEDICRTSVADGVMDLPRIAGYCDYEISQIEASTNLRLPAYYKEFLRVLGKNGGGLMAGTHLFPKSVEIVLKWRPLASRLMAMGHAEEMLPESAFVFGDHQGYQFWYFLNEPFDDNPAVFYYHENWKRPKKVNDSFTDFLLQVVEGDRRDKAWLAETSRKRDRAAPNLRKRMGISPASRLPLRLILNNGISHRADDW